MRILRTKTFSQKIIDGMRISSLGKTISVFALIVLGAGITVTAWQTQQSQDIRQRASEIPSISPSGNAGLLKVQVIPAVKSTIIIIKNPGGQIVMQETWGINWKTIQAGSYYVSFSNTGTSGMKVPKTTAFTVNEGENTEIIADFTNGNVTITYR